MGQQTKMNFSGSVALVRRDKQGRQDFKQHARERAHQQNY